jgi:hypothetical protein
MVATDIARRFGLGRAMRLSDGPVARGKQGLVWRLDTADGSWAVKAPFHRSSEEIAATDWLKPNPRSPERTDSAAWIGEVLDEPHTRALLETILESAGPSRTAAAGSPGR